MQIGNCPICGALYMKDVGRMCSACLEQEEEDAQIIAEYIRANRRCTIEEVHAVTGIKVSVIHRMLESGRIQECENLVYPCEQCKRLINKGRLCKTCMNSFLNQVKEMRGKEEKEESNHRSAGMYTKMYNM